MSHAADAALHEGTPPAVLSAPAPAAPRRGVQRATVYGYAPYWEDAMASDWDRLTHLAVFSVGITDSGALTELSRWTGVAPEVVPVAHAHGVRVHLCVTSFYDSQHAGVLPYPERRTALVEALAEQVEAYGADGVNVDFEGLDGGLNEEFALFVEELAARVEDVYIATPSVDWSSAFDYSRLAAASEGLFIMGYGYSWTGGDPGPNDPLHASSRWGTYALDWSVADYLAAGAPPDKIVLGLPLYGQEWPADSDVPASSWDDGWSVTMLEAEPIAAAEGKLWDDASASTYVLRDGTQLWYDDPADVEARIAWAVEEGLGGVGFWALGYESDPTTFWAMVQAQTQWDTPTDTGTPPATTPPEGETRVVKGEEPEGCGCGAPGLTGPAALLAFLGTRRRRAG